MTSREQQIERSKQLDKALEARARAQINVYEHRDKLRRVRQQHEALRAQATSKGDPVERSELEHDAKRTQQKLNRLEQRQAKLRTKYRECNTRVQTHVDAIGNDRERRVAELTAQREHAATRLYRLKHGTPAHRRAEQRFNAINRKLHQTQGKKDAFLEQRDRRHESTSKTSIPSRPLRDGSQRVHEFHQRPIRNDALNWRKTSIGRVQDSKARTRARRRFGESQREMHVGHVMSIEGGEDPGKSKHLFAQDPRQNQSGTWRHSEKAARRIGNANPHRQFHEQIKKSHNPQKYGSTPTHVRHQVLEDKGKSKHVVRDVTHGNFRPARNARKRPLPSAFGPKRPPVQRRTKLQRRTQATKRIPQRHSVNSAPPARPTPRRATQRPQWAKRSIELSRRRQATRVATQQRQMRAARVQRPRPQPPTMKRR